MGAHHANPRFFLNKFPPAVVQQEPALDLELWRKRITSIMGQIEQGQEITPQTCDGGLYTGVAGIGYMFMKAALSPTYARSEEERVKLMEKALRYMEMPLQFYELPARKVDLADNASFLLGALGVHALNAVILTYLGQYIGSKASLGEVASAAKTVAKQRFLRCGSDELFVGRAGYLCALSWIRRATGRSVVDENTVEPILDAMLVSGRELAARKPRPGVPLMYSYYGREYLGAAHGLTTILQMMMMFPEWMKKTPGAEWDVRQSVDFLLSIQQPNGNFPCAMDELPANSWSPADELVHWCHGAPGTVYLMARAYRLWKDERYLQSCKRCADVVWERGLLKKGPGICHGVAGNGYVFLCLYRLTKDPAYLNKARCFADFMFSEEFQSARTPDSPYSLYEGLAGTVCFLIDLLDPATAEFPFYGVFDEIKA